MTTGLEHVPTPELTAVLLGVKDAIANAVAVDPARGAEPFFIEIGILKTFEREMTARGLNPKDPNLGIDWLTAWENTA